MRVDVYLHAAGYTQSRKKAQDLISHGAVFIDGKEVKMELKKGDKVLISQYAGTKVKLDVEEYTILSQNDVLAIVFLSASL